MHEEIRKPRLVRYDDVVWVVGELRKLGLDTAQIYRRITEIGPVDLDLLAEVMRTGPAYRHAA